MGDVIVLNAIAALPTPEARVAALLSARAWRTFGPWESYALWVEAQHARTQMLLYCAEVNAKASELLLEHANEELERLRKLTA